MLNKMRVDELKSFLRLRGLKVTGKKAILVARAFSAIENNVQIVKTAEEVEKELEIDYKEKLCINNTLTIPDPFRLNCGWFEEDEGVKFWPIIPTISVINILMIDSDVEDLSDYKGSKAYSYFEKGWLDTISFHPLGNSEYCLLKADCRPSEYQIH